MTALSHTVRAFRRRYPLVFCFESFNGHSVNDPRLQHRLAKAPLVADLNAGQGAALGKPIDCGGIDPKELRHVANCQVLRISHPPYTMRGRITKTPIRNDGRSRHFVPWPSGRVTSLVPAPGAGLLAAELSCFFSEDL